LNPRNFYNNLYQDETFSKMKEQMTQELLNLD
jgi:hypothetical protein